MKGRSQPRAALLTKLSLDDLLRSGEWTGAELEASRRALPKSVFASRRAPGYG